MLSETMPSNGALTRKPLKSKGAATAGVRVVQTNCHGEATLPIREPSDSAAWTHALSELLSTDAWPDGTRTGDDREQCHNGLPRIKQRPRCHEGRPLSGPMISNHVLDL